MASVNENESRLDRSTASGVAHDRKDSRSTKASSLTAGDTPAAPPTGRRTRSRSFGDGEAVPGASGRRRGVIFTDILLIVLICGMVVGGFFGYRVLQKIYVPEQQDCEVILLVEIPRLDAEAVPPYWNANAPVYISDAVGNEPIARLSDVTSIVKHPTDSNYRTVRLVLRATAQYREGEGYFCGNTQLLAGAVYELRVDGVSASSMITAVYPTAEYEALRAAQTAESA